MATKYSGYKKKDLLLLLPVIFVAWLLYSGYSRNFILNQKREHWHKVQAYIDSQIETVHADKDFSASDPRVIRKPYSTVQQMKDVLGTPVKTNTSDPNNPSTFIWETDLSGVDFSRYEVVFDRDEYLLEIHMRDEIIGRSKLDWRKTIWTR